MKKLLISIFSIFFGLIGFSSADVVNVLHGTLTFSRNTSYTFNTGSCFRISTATCASNIALYDSSYNIVLSTGSVTRDDLVCFSSLMSVVYKSSYTSNCSASIFDLSFLLGSGSSSSSTDITVFYNNGQTASIACNGDNIITIDGLSTMSSISTFTPYFNINYTDQNNQVLTDSYSNDILYLSGGQYLKTYTGGSNNDWILNLVTSEDTVFTGYLPTFDVTGNITEIDTGNVFNNFAENSLTVLLSNIPNYIQYFIMFALLLFVLGIFRRLRK